MNLLYDIRTYEEENRCYIAPSIDSAVDSALGDAVIATEREPTGMYSKVLASRLCITY